MNKIIDLWLDLWEDYTATMAIGSLLALAGLVLWFGLTHPTQGDDGFATGIAVGLAMGHY